MLSRFLILVSITVLLSFNANANQFNRHPLISSPYDVLPSFSADYYLRSNADVANAFGKTNYQMARWHWDSYGRYEGRASSPSFHVRDYLELHADVRNQFGQNYNDVLWHFNAYGINEGRQSTHAFNVRDYIRMQGSSLSSGDFRAAYIDWATHGVNWGRQGDDDFWVIKYLDAHPDLQRNLGESSFVDAYIHWLLRGRAEGRNDGMSKGFTNCTSGPTFAGGNRMFSAPSDQYSEFIINATEEVAEVRDIWNSRGFARDKFNAYPNPVNAKQIIISVDLRNNATFAASEGSWFFTMANNCGASSLSGNLTQQAAAEQPPNIDLPPPPGILPPPSQCNKASYSAGSTTVSKGGSTTFTLSEMASSVEVYNNGSGITAQVNGNRLTVSAPFNSSSTWYSVHTINDCGRETISGSITK